MAYGSRGAVGRSSQAVGKGKSKAAHAARSGKEKGSAAHAATPEILKFVQYDGNIPPAGETFLPYEEIFLRAISGHLKPNDTKEFREVPEYPAGDTR